MLKLAMLSIWLFGCFDLHRFLPSLVDMAFLSMMPSGMNHFLKAKPNIETRNAQTHILCPLPVLIYVVSVSHS